MEFLRAHIGWIVTVGLLLMLFIIRFFLRRRKKRKIEADISQRKRRDDALTEALRNPLSGVSQDDYQGPVEIKWDDKAVNEEKGTPVKMVELVELSRYSRRKYIFRADDPIKIGSGPDNQMVLPREGVEKAHCIIQMHEKKPCVRSVSGAQTLLLRGRKKAFVGANAVYLNNGDQLQIGSTTVQFRLFIA